ncbi:MAG: L-threonylcarbamoyladenylate synthase [bacterium]
MLQITSEQIEQALKVLRRGGVVVFPTETSYGLGCDATNESAVSRIFEIKGREGGKGLPVLIPSVDSASDFVDLSEAARDLASRFWPGALNIIAPVAEGSSIVERCGQDGTQSVRVSSHPFATTLTHQLGKPLVATSANVSGSGDVYSVRDVKANFRDRPQKPDLFIDGGDLPASPPSTTVKIVGDEVEVIRQGSVLIE